MPVCDIERGIMCPCVILKEESRAVCDIERGITCPCVILKEESRACV